LEIVREEARVVLFSASCWFFALKFILAGNTDEAMISQATAAMPEDEKVFVATVAEYSGPVHRCERATASSPGRADQTPVTIAIGLCRSYS
jgi:hypothetical protein